MNAEWIQCDVGFWQLKLGAMVIARIYGPDGIRTDYSWTIRGVIFKERQSGPTLEYAKKSVEHFIQNFNS